MRIGLFGLVCVSLLMIACGDAKSPETTPSAAAPTTPTQISPTATPSEETASAPTSPEETAEAEPTAEAAKTEAPTPPSPETTTAAADMATTKPTTASDAHREQLDLAKKSGCLACHAIDKKVVGPAWNDVAKRYAADSNAKDKLTEKVAKGGRGNWTEVVGNMAMPPYSPRVSNENIEKLVDFILSLK